MITAEQRALMLKMRTEIKEATHKLDKIAETLMGWSAVHVDEDPYPAHAQLWDNLAGEIEDKLMELDEIADKIGKAARQ